MSKFQKTVLPSSGDSVAGWSSRMSVQSHVLVTCPHRFFSWLTSGSMPSHEKYLEYFSKFGFLMFFMTQSSNLFAGERFSHGGTQKFCGLPRDFLTGRTSSREKHLEKFFKIFVFSDLATSPGDFLTT